VSALLVALFLLTTQREPSASISGRVTDRDSGRPLPRIVATLIAPGGSHSEAITDAEGLFKFLNLSPGKYSVGAAQDEHRSTYLRQWYGEEAPAALFAGPQRANIELAAGQARTGSDIALTRGLAIEGRIMDPSDEPMANVEVRVTGPDGRTVASRSVSSDDLGVYRIYGLAPGRYRACAEVRERSEVLAYDGARMVRTCHPAAVLTSAARDVTLMAQHATGIDIRVQRVGSYSISGVVIDAAGLPADQARVTAVAPDIGGGTGTATSANGAFLLKGITPGNYIVQAAVGGGRFPDDPNPPARELEMGSAPIDVDGDVTGLAVTLSKAATVVGKVVFEGGDQPPGDRKPLVVHAVPVDAAQRLSRPPFVLVKDDLTFALTGLYPMRILLRLQQTPDPWVVRSVRYEGRDVNHVPTDFARGSSRSPVEIRLTNRVARPSVRVTDQQDAPLTSYELCVVPADPAAWQTGYIIVPGTPSADGVLKTGPLLPGEYLIAALSPADIVVLLGDPDRVNGLAAVGTRVTLSIDDNRTFDLRIATLPEKR